MCPVEATAPEHVQRVDDAAHLVAPIVLAFAGDPFVRSLWPDPQKFLDVFTELTRLHARKTAAHGGAWGRPDGRSAAFWYPPGVHPDHEELDRVWSLAGGPTDEIVPVFEETGRHEPQGPYWYLRQIGVDPALMRAGYGSAVIQPGLEVADEAGLPAYLEATSRPGVVFYERHGFIALAEVKVGRLPPLWPMVREPR